MAECVRNFIHIRGKRATGAALCMKNRIDYGTWGPSRHNVSEKPNTLRAGSAILAKCVRYFIHITEADGQQAQLCMKNRIQFSGVMHRAACLTSYVKTRKARLNPRFDAKAPTSIRAQLRDFKPHCRFSGSWRGVPDVPSPPAYCSRRRTRRLAYGCVPPRQTTAHRR